MPDVGSRCHELRVDDRDKTWRIVYRADPDAVIILGVFEKKTRQTPERVIEECRKRFGLYDDPAGKREKS